MAEKSGQASQGAAPHHKKFSWGGAAAMVLALAMIVTGVVLLWRGPTHHEPPGEEMPSRPFAVAHPVASGPKSAKVGERHVTPETMGANKIFIPQLGIIAGLVDEHFSKGQMGIPDNPALVGRDLGSPAVSAKNGTTLLAGHVRYGITPGALKHLAQLEPGARIYVSDAAGKPHAFVTASLEAYVKRKLPESVFAHSGTRRLAVVTCGGPIVWLDGERHFRDNIVAMAVPAG